MEENKIDNSTILQKTKIFNPDGNDSIPHVIGNSSTNIINLNQAHYKWAKKYFKSMLNSFWLPEKIDLTGDNIKELTEHEKEAYYSWLSFLIFLDSIQTNNLPRLNDYIDNAEIKVAISTQEFFEVIHSYSYSYIIESIIPASDRNMIYDYWRTNPVLFERNQLIAGIYQDFQDNPTFENFKKTLIANFALEGIYFYSGFLFFYNLASRQKMKGTAAIIKLINRDELIHCSLFESIIRNVMDIEEYKDLIYEMMDSAVQQEIKWNTHIIGDNILGMDLNSVTDYTKYICNRRLKKLGLAPLYPKVKNNFKHLEKIADLLGDGNVKSNFFEAAGVTSYNMATSIEGWDF